MDIMIRQIFKMRTFLACVLAATTGMMLYFCYPCPDEKEVLVGKGIAEIEHHTGRRGGHACEEGSHLKDLPNHDVHSSEQPLGLSGSVLGPFRILRASRREEARAEFDCPRRIHLAKEPSPWLSPRLGMDPGGIEPVDFTARKA